MRRLVVIDLWGAVKAKFERCSLDTCVDLDSVFEPASVPIWRS